MGAAILVQRLKLCVRLSAIDSGHHLQTCSSSATLSPRLDSASDAELPTTPAPDAC